MRPGADNGQADGSLARSSGTDSGATIAGSRAVKANATELSMRAAGRSERRRSG